MSPNNIYTKHRPHVLCISVIIVLFFAVRSELTAAPRTDSKARLLDQKEKAAKKACLSGDMKGGIELLADLYADTNHLTYIYNQARCYQQNNELELALNRFREYLRKGPELGPKEKDALDRNMEECQKLIAEQRPSQMGEGSPPKSEPTEKPQDQTLPALPLFVNDNPLKAPKPLPGRGLKVAGAITASFGLCALGVGLTYHWFREDLLSKVEDQKFQTTSEKNDLDTYKKVYLVSYGVGAVAIVTGVTLYLIGVSNSDSEPTVALVPSFLPGETTLTLRGLF